MPNSWHSHRGGLGKGGDHDFSHWQRAVDGPRSQASARMPGKGVSFWLGPEKSLKLLHSSSLVSGSLSPELATSPSEGVSRISLFQELLNSYLSMRQQVLSCWI